MARVLVTFWNLHRISILLLLLSLLFYGTFAHNLVRSDTWKLLTLFGALFFLCFKLIQFEKWNFRFLVVAGILFRLVFWMAEPNLSQDFYRFIWDGILLNSGLNPYAYTPDGIMAQGIPESLAPVAETLYEGMGDLSARNYSNYPPFNQYLFALCTWLGGKTVIGSVAAMRLLILAADIGLLYFGRRLLFRLNKASWMIFWYFLNPLVIIELTGNLHFEGVMGFFLVLAFFLLHRFGWILAAIPFALSIALKLIPLMLLPLMLPLLGFKRAIGFYLITGLCLLGLLYPLYFAEFPEHYAATLKLWFANFEFNAGIYRVFEWFAERQGEKPWEFIARYGEIVPWITAGSCIVLTFHPRMRQLKTWFSGALAVLAIYYFSSAVVHPWYLILPLILSLFTRFRFVLLWSLLVVISYTAYSGTQVEEATLWLWIEYLPVFGMLIYEIIRNRREFVTFVKNETQNPEV